MASNLIYTPILRLRQEEQKVLTSFDFGEHIYPYVEIIKETDRQPVTMRNGKKVVPKKIKTFEEIHLEIINRINAPKVFIDLPVHMKESNRVKPEVLSFLRKVVASRQQRTNYMIKLFPLSKKIIPVISTYSQRTGELNSIKLQESDLRPYFNNLAFRTVPSTFNNDLVQIQAIAQKQDYLIVDLDTYPADPNDEDVLDILDKLKTFVKCHIIIVRSAMDDSITNVGLDHGKKVKSADNSLLEEYATLYGNSFGDYAGIKKDGVYKGGGRSPGFVYYDSTENNFYGFRGSLNFEGKSNQNLKDFETIIVPAVISSNATLRMKASPIPFLTSDNKGWQTILDIDNGFESGKSPAKFKRIAIEHYLHCMKSKINAEEFN